MALKTTIKEMKKRKDQTVNSLKSSIMQVRMEIAKRLEQASKVGNSKTCFEPNQTDGKFIYCDNNFATNYLKYEDCKNPASFCYVCCENEFGEMHIMERDECFKTCDATPEGSKS